MTPTLFRTHRTLPFITRVGLVALACIVPPALAAQQAAAAASANETVIRGGWLFDGVHDARVRNTGIVVRNGKFLEVGANLTGRDLSKSRVIELGDDATILPGFTDMHAHYNIDFFSEGRVEEAKYSAMLHLANGVMSTWSAGEFFTDKMLAAKRDIESGRQPGTRIFISGPYFGAFRCEYKIKTAQDDCIGWPNTLTEAQIRTELDYWIGLGVRSIKIKQSTPEEMRILIDEAHRNGVTTTSHIANYADVPDIDTRDAILMGLDRVEHMIVLSDPKRADQPTLKQMIDLFIAHHVYFDANMQMWGGAQLRNLPELNPKMVWVDEAQFFTPYVRQMWADRAAQSAARRAASAAAGGGGRGRGAGADSGGRGSGAGRANAPARPPLPMAPINNYGSLTGFRSRAAELKAFYDAGGGALIILGTDQPVSGPSLPAFAYHREMEAMVYAGLPTVAVLKAATINGARALGMGDQLGSIETGKIADVVIVTGNPLENITAAREIRTVMKAGQVYDPKALLAAARDKIGPSSEVERSAWTLYDKVPAFGVHRP